MKTGTKRELFLKCLCWRRRRVWRVCRLLAPVARLLVAGKYSRATVLAESYRCGRKTLWEVHAEVRGEKLLG